MADSGLCSDCKSDKKPEIHAAANIVKIPDYRRIRLLARIVAVADVFDALTSRRPYKEAWSIERAMEVIRDECGKYFDPVIVDVLERALPRLMEIYQNYKHI
jgi:response regulator RpfG family c-di-GMP phosphodiesterase